jgi:glycosyltransferase involved in cell wall biosynthesis
MPCVQKIVMLAPVVPDTPEYRTPAFSRAGNMFITNLVHALTTMRCAPVEIVSFLPIPAFPRSRRLWVPREVVEVAGIRTLLVGFVNLPVVKYFAIGIGMLMRAARVASASETEGSRSVIYCYNAVSPVGPAGLAAAWIAKCLAVVSVNDVWKPGELVPDTLTWRFDYWCQRRLIPRFDGAVVVTDKVMEDLAPRQRYVRIDGGVSAEVFARTSTRPPATDATTFHIVASGSLDEVNGVIELLEAFRLLPDPHYRLTIAGGGPLESFVRAAAARDSRICYAGLLPFAEVLDLYRRADLLANVRLTQRIDSQYFFPSKLMEYLASGTPVLSTSTGHLESEYGDFVFLASDESPEGLARAIEQAAATSGDVRTDMARRARAYMLANKTWNIQADKITRFLGGLPSRG